MGEQRRTDTGSVKWFVGLTFGISWLMALLFWISGIEWGSPAAFVFAVAYMLVPLICAVWVQKIIRGKPVLGPLRVSFRPDRWWLVAWLGPVALAVAAFAVALLFSGVQYAPDMSGLFERLSDMLPPEALQEMQLHMSPTVFLWMTLLQTLLAGPTINAVLAFGEELGWRGFLQKALGHLNFWKSSAVIGLIWGLWHAPLILQGHNYPNYPVVGVFMMTVWCVLLSPMFSYVTLRSGSVIPAAIMHGSLNASYGLSVMLLRGGSELLVGISGLAGFVVLLAVNLAIYLAYPETAHLAADSLLPED